MPHTALLSRTLTSSRKMASSHSLRRAAGLGLGLLSLLGASVGPACAGSVNWDGTVADWFSNPSHWSNGSIPGAGDDAVNSTTAAMTFNGNDTVNSFFSNGAFSLQSGTFTGNQANSASTITVNNVFTVDGGQINNFTVNQGSGGSLVFTGSGNNAITNSIINSSMDLATNANAYLQTVGAVTENGTISLGTTSNGLQIVNGGSSLTLGSMGGLVGFGNVYQYQGTTLTNNGTVNANSAGNALNLGISAFNNTGTAEATNGATLNLSNTIASSGALNAIGANSIVSLTGTFTGTGGSTTNLITASGGGAVQVNGATLAGTINEASGTALVFNGSGNNFLGGGTTINGNLDLATNANAFLGVVGAVTVNGSIKLGTTSNGLQIDNQGSSLTLASGSLTGFGNVYQYQGTTLTSSGLINANSKGNTLNLGVSQFNNNFIAEATNGGTLAFNSTNVANNDAIAADGQGSAAVLTGTFTNGANSLFSATNGGQIQVNGATLLGTINTDSFGSGTALIFTGSGNNLLGDGTIVNGNLDLATNANAYLQTVGAVTVNGNINLGTTSNGLQIVNGGSSLTLGTSGSLTGFGNVYQYQGISLANNGTVNANSAGNTLNLGISNFTNTGTAEATNGGILNLSNTIANSGFVKADGAGSIVGISGAFTGTGDSTTNLITASGGGQVQANGVNLLGTINEASGTALVFNGSGNNFLGGGTTINGNLDLATNANAFLGVVGAVTVNGTISLGTTSNGLQIVNGGSSLTLGSGGGLTGFGSVYQYQGTTLTNNGTVNANSSSAPLSLQVSQFTNNGTAEATNGGTLNLSNSNTNASDGSKLIANGTGSVASITGTYTGAGSDLITASGGGQVQVNGATLAGTINEASGTALVFNGSGGNVLSDGTTINGNLDLATNTNAFLQTVGTVTENGTISLGTTSNGLQIVNGGSNLTLGSGGGLTGFGTVSQYQGTSLINNGTVSANSAGNTLNINTSGFTNTGTTEVQNGAALSVTSANTDSGNVLVKTGGTATFTQGLTQTAGLTQADGTLNSPLTLTGGTLAGTGTVVGAVTNTGGTVSAGNSASPFGTLAVSGTFNQGSGGTLDAGFSSTQNNLLAVTEAVTTGGVLNVNYLGSGAYTGSGPFTFLDYGSLGTEPTNALGFTQYFSNETFLTDGTGIIDGSNGFTYELLNDTTNNGLQLEVLTQPMLPAVPEASTTVSLGILLLLGGAGLWRVKRRTAD